MKKITEFYNFADIRNLSMEEIAELYKQINTERVRLFEQTDYKEFIEKIEAIDKNRDLIGHYLARAYCKEHGYMGAY